jgi:4-hydroxybenzoate polyprenyltransferase
MLDKRLIRRLYLYSKERYNVFQFVPLALILGTILSFGTRVFFAQHFSITLALQSAAALFLFLFRLRIFDEFKDFEHDQKHYPMRPLQRGLISKSELRALVPPIVVAEIVLAYSAGHDAILLYIVALLYSVLMYKEFFIACWLKDHFTAYIASHEVLIFPLYLYISALSGLRISYLLSYPFFWLLIIYAGAALFILEITRKVRPSEHEVASRDTYTAQYGVDGTIKLLLTMTALMYGSQYLFLHSIGSGNWAALFISAISVFPFLFYLDAFRKSRSSKNAKMICNFSIGFVFTSFILTIAALLLS